MYTSENGEKEPDWVQTERTHFSEFRDTNKVKKKKTKLLSFLSAAVTLSTRRHEIASVPAVRMCDVCLTQDGFLDADEVARWVLPGEVDHADNEAKHLIHETDTDKVGCVM